jgi:hypothetical protein
MVNKELAPEHLRWDFIEPVLELKPPLSLTLAKALSLITVPMLSYLGCVPVKRGIYYDVQDSLHESVALLKEGKIVLIVPEEPEGTLEPQTKMKPFLKGFTRLGEIFYKDTGKLLSFISSPSMSPNKSWSVSLSCLIQKIRLAWKDLVIKFSLKTRSRKCTLKWTTLKIPTTTVWNFRCRHQTWVGNFGLELSSMAY